MNEHLKIQQEVLSKIFEDHEVRNKFIRFMIKNRTQGMIFDVKAWKAAPAVVVREMTQNNLVMDNIGEITNLSHEDMETLDKNEDLAILRAVFARPDISRQLKEQAIIDWTKGQPGKNFRLMAKLEGLLGNTSTTIEELKTILHIRKNAVTFIAACDYPYNLPEDVFNRLDEHPSMDVKRAILSRKDTPRSLVYQMINCMKDIHINDQCSFLLKIITHASCESHVALDLFLQYKNRFNVRYLPFDINKRWGNEFVENLKFHLTME